MFFFVVILCEGDGCMIFGLCEYWFLVFFFKQRFGMILGDVFFFTMLLFFGFVGWREVQKSIWATSGLKSRKLKLVVKRPRVILPQIGQNHEFCLHNGIHCHFEIGSKGDTRNYKRRFRIPHDMDVISPANHKTCISKKNWK